MTLPREKRPRTCAEASDANADDEDWGTDWGVDGEKGESKQGWKDRMDEWEQEENMEEKRTGMEENEMRKTDTRETNQPTRTAAAATP